MTTLNRNKPRAFQVDNSNGLPVAAATQIYEGAAVGVHASTGYCRPLVSGDKFAGFAVSRVDNRAGAAAAAWVRLTTRGEVELPVTGAVATSLGATVYATDDDSFTLSPGGSPVGYVKRVPSAGVAVVAFDVLAPALTASQVEAVRQGWDRAAGRARNRTLKRFSDTVGVGAANSGTAAAVSIDAASPFGRPAYKVDMPAGNTYHEVQLAGFNIARGDAHVVWTVWVQDYSAIQQIQVFAGTSGYARYWQHNHAINNSNVNRLSGEHRIIAGPLYAGTTNTFVTGVDTLADCKLRIFPGAAGGIVWVDACVVAGVGRPTHCITYDDASVTWITAALPDLAAAGVAATFGINTGQIGTNGALYVTAAQVQQIVDAGHAICSHNVANTALNDGTGGTQTAAQYAADFSTAAAALGAIVGSGFDTTYHPWVQGRNSQAGLDAMRAAGMRIGRGVDPGHNLPQAGLGMHGAALKCQSVHTLTTAQIDAVIAAAERYGTTVVWMIHEVTPAGGVGVETSEANHRYLVQQIGQRVASGRAVARTMPELARELYTDSLVATALL